MHYDTFHLGTNDRVRYNGELYRPEKRDDRARSWVLRRLSDGSALDGHPWRLSDKEHYRLRRAEALVVDEQYFSTAGRLLSARADDSDMNDLSDDQLLTVYWKIEWCVRFYRARGLLDGHMEVPPCTPAGLETFIQRERETIHRWYVKTFGKARPAGRTYKGMERKTFDWPGPTTLRDWLALYEAKGRKMKAFRPEYRRCGNRNQIDSLVVRVIEREILGYASRAQPTISDIYQNVEDRLEKLNRSRPPEDQLYVSERAVRRRIHKLDPVFVDAGRMGIVKAGLKYMPVGHGLETVDGLKPLERMDRVEIDDWEMDLFVLVNHKHAQTKLSPKARELAETVDRAARCTITVALDVATRCVVGINVSPHPPSVAGSRGALRSILVDKAPLARNAKTLCEWPMMAKPREIASDGGSVFQGAFHDTLERLGIGHRFPGGNPTRRGTIESFFRNLKALCRRFTGQSFSNVVKRGDYTSTKMASLLAEDLEGILIKYLIDHYHQRSHPELGGARPQTVWDKANNTLVGPPSAEQRQLAFGIRLNDRTIDARGITFLHIEYRHDKMALLRGRIGNRRLTAIVDPHDIGKIFVRTPDEAKEGLEGEGDYMTFAARKEFSGVSALRHMNNSSALNAFEAKESAEGRPFRLDALRAIKSAAEKARIRAGIPSDGLSNEEYVKLFAEFERAGKRATKPRPAPAGSPMSANDEPGVLGVSLAKPAGSVREVRNVDPTPATRKSINRLDEDDL